MTVSSGAPGARAWSQSLWRRCSTVISGMRCLLYAWRIEACSSSFATSARTNAEASRYGRWWGSVREETAHLALEQ